MPVPWHRGRGDSARARRPGGYRACLCAAGQPPGAAQTSRCADQPPAWPARAGRTQALAPLHTLGANPAPGSWRTSPGRPCPAANVQPPVQAVPGRTTDRRKGRPRSAAAPVLEPERQSARAAPAECNALWGSGSWATGTAPWRRPLHAGIRAVARLRRRRPPRRPPHTVQRPAAHPGRWVTRPQLGCLFRATAWPPGPAPAGIRW